MDSASDAPGKATLVRRLALAKVRELRRSGLSYREIGRRYALPRHAGDSGPGFEHRLPAERLLAFDAEAAMGWPETPDAALFVRALDTLEQGLAFYSRAGRLLHANRALAQRLDHPESGASLRLEVDHFAHTLAELLRLREVPPQAVLEELDLRDVPLGEAHLRLKGSYLGFPLLGAEGVLLVALEPPPADPLSTEALRTRFGFTRQEARIARLLVEGRSNQEIARALSISPHTARHHTEKILLKLRARSRAEVASRVLQRGATPNTRAEPRRLGIPRR